MAKQNVARKTVQNRARLLLAQKEHAERRKITYDDMRDETSLATSTISAIMTNSMRRYDVDTLATLITYFGCTFDEFFEIIEVTEDVHPLAQGQEAGVTVVTA